MKCAGAFAACGFEVEVVRDVTGIKAGAVPGDLRARCDQPAALGAASAVVDAGDFFGGTADTLFDHAATATTLFVEMNDAIKARGVLLVRIEANQPPRGLVTSMVSRIV